VGRMHADESDIDTGLVRRLLATQFPHWADRPIRPVASSGTDNAMFRLGDDLAVRLPRVRRASADIETEQRWLPTLAPHLPVAIPEIVEVGEPTEDLPWRWSVNRWLTGRNPQVDALDEPEDLAIDLAEFIIALHSIDPTGAPKLSRSGPLANRAEPTTAAITASEGLVDTAALHRIWAETLVIDTQAQALRQPIARPNPALASATGSGPAGPERDSAADPGHVASPTTLAPAPVRPGSEGGSARSAWAHGDLSPGNVLIDQGRLRAVIDFGGFGVGDPTVDLVIAWNLLPAAARPVLRAALEVDDATWARGRGWALSIAAIQLPYYLHTNPALAANSRHVLDAIVADQRLG
jgi:aminoglycoside phosphotransferase (APT) family kinase protein